MHNTQEPCSLANLTNAYGMSACPGSDVPTARQASKVPSGSWSYASSLFANVDAAVRQLPRASSSTNHDNGNAADLLLQGGGLIDVASWVDFLLGTELSCDYDAYVSSVFLHKVGLQYILPLACCTCSRSRDHRATPYRSGLRVRASVAGLPVSSARCPGMRCTWYKHTLRSIAVGAVAACRIGAGPWWPDLCGTRTWPSAMRLAWRRRQAADGGECTARRVRDFTSCATVRRSKAAIVSFAECALKPLNRGIVHENDVA